MAKDVILDLLESRDECAPSGNGLKSTEIFRLCGLDWGDKQKATSTNQQYWVVAALRELEEEELIERVSESGPWRLR